MTLESGAALQCRTHVNKKIRAAWGGVKGSLARTPGHRSVGKPVSSSSGTIRERLGARILNASVTAEAELLRSAFTTFICLWLISRLLEVGVSCAHNALNVSYTSIQRSLRSKQRLLTGECTLLTRLLQARIPINSECIDVFCFHAGSVSGTQDDRNNETF